MDPGGLWMQENKRENAVSELIGAILLISLVVLAMAIITVAVLSQPPPGEIPHLNALAGNSTDAIYLYHNGGDELAEAEAVIYLNNNPAPVDHAIIRLKDADGTVEQDGWSITKTPWSVGKTLIIPESAGSVTLVYQGPSAQSLILKTSFAPGVTGTAGPVTASPTASSPTTTPVTPTATTTIPPTNATTPVTTSPTSIPTTNVTTTVTTAVTTSPIPTSPTPTATPAAGKDTLLNSERGGYVEDGSQVAFRVETGGSSSHITIGGIQYNLAVGDVVSLLINGDSTNVEIDMNNNHISRFSFPDVSVYRGGAFLARGSVTDLWISEYSSMTSSLTVIVPSYTPVWTNFVYSGNPVIYGDHGGRIEIYNLYPKSSNQYMRLDVQDANTYYDGGATGYLLT